MSLPLGRRRLPLVAAAAVAALAVVLAGCSGSASSASATAGPAADQSSTVTVALTPQGCSPMPASITAGAVDFNVSNSGAGSVSEAELRTSDRSKILGEQENLTPGLSGGFSLTLQPGRYDFYCPGASQQHWTFTVTGKATAAANWQASPQLATAVSGYSGYITQNTSALVTSSQAFCQAVNAGDKAQAEVLYPKARVYYERIEPVAEIWGSLDTAIDGRWENPVTVASQFTGFHRIEQLLWEDNTLAGATAQCAGLIKNEKQLLTLVESASYNPLEMASGSTDLLGEASTAKISGEEERYSNTDLPVLQANVDGAMEVVSLLTPYLDRKDPSLLAAISKQNAAVTRVMATLKSSPGYDQTGYIEYSAIGDSSKKQLSGAINALAEDLSKLGQQVSS